MHLLLGGQRPEVGRGRARLCVLRAVEEFAAIVRGLGSRKGLVASLVCEASCVKLSWADLAWLLRHDKGGSHGNAKEERSCWAWLTAWPRGARWRRGSMLELG